jgi:hypothetical protein
VFSIPRRGWCGRYAIVSYGSKIYTAKIASGATSIVLAGNIAGSANGIGTLANFQNPFGLAITSKSTAIYAVDKVGMNVRKLSIPAWLTTTSAKPTGKHFLAFMRRPTHFTLSIVTVFIFQHFPCIFFFSFCMALFLFRSHSPLLFH